MSVRFDSQYLAAHPCSPRVRWRCAARAPACDRNSGNGGSAQPGRAMQSIVAFAAAAPHSLRPAFVCVHTIALLSFVRASERVFDAQFTASDRAAAWTAAWLASGVVTVLSWALAITPLHRWTSAITQGRALLLKASGSASGLECRAVDPASLEFAGAVYLQCRRMDVGLIYRGCDDPIEVHHRNAGLQSGVSRQCSGLRDRLILAF